MRWIHRISVLRAHLHSLDRTHVPLPQAQIKVP
jgi:hypothetical protein